MVVGLKTIVSPKLEVSPFYAVRILQVMLQVAQGDTIVARRHSEDWLAAFRFQEEAVVPAACLILVELFQLLHMQLLLVVEKHQIDVSFSLSSSPVLLR